jgi:aminoglycoside phosphotransferase (APT) family kinase protein
VELLKRPLADYIRHLYGEEAVLEHDVRHPRGSSRLTWFVDYRERPGADLSSIVLRADFEGGSTIHSSLEQEYFMYDRLGQSAVPVAPVLRWEADEQWAERPFYIRQQIKGDWEIPHFKDPDPQYDAMRIAVSKEHMRKLALVHQVDWKALGFDTRLSAPASRETCASHFIDRLMAQLADFQREPMPVVVECLAALKKGAPVAPCVSLCKGTNGLGEEIFMDGEIVAMSDWEEASIGDPAADFASLQDLIPEIERDGAKIWGLEQALSYYREVSGIDLPIENVHFYQRLRTLGAILYGHKAAVVLHNGKADIRQAWTGTEVFHLAKRMLAGAGGLGKPIDPAWFAQMNETVA